MRKFLFAFILLLGIIFVATRISEFNAVLNTLKKGIWWVLLIAATLQVFWLLNVAASYKYIFKSIGIDVPLGEMIFISGAVFLSNIVAPSVGMSGVAILVDYTRRKKQSVAQAAIVNTLFIEFDLIGFIGILPLGLFVLIRRNNLTLSELTASLILFTAAVILTFLLYLGTKSESALNQTLTYLARFINKLLKPFLHRDYLSEDRAHSFAAEAANGLLELRQEPRRILAPALLGFSSKLILFAIFSLMFFAFNAPISLGTFVAGYTIAFLFLIVSPTPAGLGFVEGALTLTLSTMFIPLGTAVVITIAYRAFTFWLPFFWGLICLRIISSTKMKNHIGLA